MAEGGHIDYSNRDFVVVGIGLDHKMAGLAEVLEQRIGRLAEQLRDTKLVTHISMVSQSRLTKCCQNVGNAGLFGHRDDVRFEQMQTVVVRRARVQASSISLPKQCDVAMCEAGKQVYVEEDE